jgi:hypothetical protein
MPMRERPSTAQQENIISLLAHSEQHGRVIAALVDAQLFDGDYKLIALRLVKYWKDFNSAPGPHTIDLFGDITDDISNARHAQAFRRILLDMAELAPRVNTTYVLTDLQTFTRGQLLADAVLRCAAELSRGNVDIAAVEEILAQVLRARTLNFDRGSRLDDDLDPFLSWLETRNTEFATGIKPFDDMGIVPARGAVLLFIAGKARGKSWFLTNIGKCALMLKQRVLHVSLENDEFECRLRYYQALFAAARHGKIRDRAGVEQSYVTVPVLSRHDDPTKAHQIVGIAGVTDAEDDKGKRETPEFSFDSPELGRVLRAKIAEKLRGRGELIIKRFANRSLSIDALAAYLDTLEQVDRFTPDILVLDYAKLLKLPGNNAQDRRVGIGDNFERLRALAIERNMAVVTADQLNRPGYNAKRARSTHVSEDWSQIHTADVVITHSATDSEHQRGLARLWVDHARGERDKFGVIVTQNFTLGQFCVDAGLIPAKYYESMQPHDSDDSSADDARTD